MGLDTLPPGNHAYTWFYGAANCDWNAAGKSRVALRDPGLRYFSFAGESSFFFWSRSRQTFLRAHVSRPGARSEAQPKSESKAGAPETVALHARIAGIVDQ